MTSFSPPYGDDKQRRVANDGTAYTFDEFSNYYGIWCEAYWSAAAPTIPQNNVEKLVKWWSREDPIPSERSTSASRSSDVTQRTNAAASVPPSDFPLHCNQSAGDANSSVIQPAVRSDPIRSERSTSASRSIDVTQPTNAAASAPPSNYLLHCNQSAGDTNSSVIQSVGKKMWRQVAWAKQRELRKQLLTHRTDSQRKYEYDLTHDGFNWQAVIRSLKPDVQKLLSGTGIIKFSFKLLSGVIDTNYVHCDAGYRHVFEIERKDGSCYHLHFHKNCTCDSPVWIQSAAAVNDSGDTLHVSEPKQRFNINYDRDTLSKIESSWEIPTISKNETLMALSLMLGACTPWGDIAIDITDGESFNWRRWMTKERSSEVTWTGIVKVFVVRRSADNAIQIACCRTDKTFTTTTVPRNKNKYSTSQSQNHWTSEPIFSSPWIIRKDWIRFREEPNVQSSRQIVIPPVAVWQEFQERKV